ncbi:hypothetical protein BKH31_11455 [Actinomyces oris]|uniref:Uncharacterized protein n=1 Tax=Actinomyces oris TaxID=544580 RepID=A0A1Q8V7K8_9ACTO|nr:hypothetical protein BKH31_11455 [Actinomyces oris]
MRVVVYVLVLLVVIGMILAVAGSALATAAPTAVAPEPAPEPASGATSASRPAPVVVLATNNLTWADLREQASREGVGEDSGSSGVGSAAAHLLAFAARGEPMNLSVRTPADRTCPADAWLTLGRGRRASAIEPAASCAGPTATIPRNTPLAGALGRDVSIQTVGPGTQLATGAPGGARNSPAPLAPSVAEALAADADLTIVDTARAASTDTERIAALDDALRTVQEQARPGTRLVIASLADDEAPGPQMAVLPAGTRSARGTSDGLVVGDSTHQPGLAQLTDLTPTLVSALAGRRDPAFDGHALTLPQTGRAGVATAGDATGDARISRLADDALHARASQATVMRAGALLMGLAVVLLAWAAVALRDPKASRREALRRRVTWAAVYLSALPTALLLVNAAPWWRVGARESSPSGWASLVAVVAAALVATGIVGLAAGIVALARRHRRPRPGASPLPSPDSPTATAAAEPAGSTDALCARGEAAAEPQPDEAEGPTPSASTSPPPSGAGLTALLVAAAIPLTWLVDAAAGAPLAFNNPLGMNAVVAGRFYGVSNTAFALVAGALVVVIAGVWVALGGGRRTTLLVTALLGGAALLVDGAPQLGADVGGALTLVPTLAFLGAGLAGLRLSWRRWLAIGAAAVLVVGGFAIVDLIRPGGPTHLGRFARQVADGSAAGVLGRKAYALVGPFITKPVMVAALACVVTLVAAALWWGRRQVRAWHNGTSPYAWLAPNAHGGIPRVGGQDSGPPTRGMSPSARWVTTALKSLGVLTLVAVLVNDSGVTMAGFILAAAAPTLLALTLLLGDSFTASRHLHRRRHIIPGSQRQSSTSPS